MYVLSSDLVQLANKYAFKGKQFKYLVTFLYQIRILFKLEL